ncbi:MAG: 50S ribosomal protein L13 [Acidimicrobiales bacterium]
MRTYTPKPTEVERAWYQVDAEGAVLGRLAAEVARVLRGKHKPTFAPHLDTGDHVVVVNAAKVVMTSDKASTKLSYRHSGYPGGLKSTSYRDLLERRPEEVVRKAVKGMLPRGTLGRSIARKLKVYAGPEHPHVAQNPQPLVVDHSVHRSA